MTRTRRRTRMTIPRYGRGYLRLSGRYGRATGLGKELKFFDRDNDDVVISNTGDVSGSLIGIPQGVGDKERIGRKIIIRSIDWRVSFELSTTGTTSGTTDQVRILLILDRQCNGAAPTVLDILETTDYLSFYNLANSMRFTVLVDKTFVLNATAAGGDGVGNFDGAVVGRSFKTHLKCAFPIEYDLVTGAIAGIRSNNLISMYISKSANAGLESKFRFRYSDS